MDRVVGDIWMDLDQAIIRIDEILGDGTVVVSCHDCIEQHTIPEGDLATPYTGPPVSFDGCIPPPPPGLHRAQATDEPDWT